MIIRSYWLVLAIALSTPIAARVHADALYRVTSLGRRSMHAINNGGQVAGEQPIDDSSVRTEAVVYHAYGPDGGRILPVSANRPSPYGSDLYPYFTYAINDAGHTVGSAFASDRTSRAILGRDGTVTELVGLPGIVTSSAVSINNRGDIVGSAYTNRESPQERAVQFIDGRARELDGMAGRLGVAEDINDVGQVIGRWTGEQSTRGFLLGSGRFTDLGSLGGRVTWPDSINNRGQVVGSADTPGGRRRAFLYENSSIRELGALGGESELSNGATAINDSGQIVGGSSYSGGRAFLYSDGRMQDLNELVPPDTSWVLTSARDINNQGQILVDGYRRDDARRDHVSLLLTPSSLPDPVPPAPIPEPTPLMLLCAVGFAILLRRIAAGRTMRGRVAGVRPRPPDLKPPGFRKPQGGPDTVLGVRVPELREV